MTFFKKSFFLRNNVFVFIKSKLHPTILNYFRNAETRKKIRNSLKAISAKKDAYYKSFYKTRGSGSIAKSKLLFPKVKTNYSILHGKGVAHRKSSILNKPVENNVFKRFIKEIINEPLTATKPHLVFQNQALIKFRKCQPILKPRYYLGKTPFLGDDTLKLPIATKDPCIKQQISQSRLSTCELHKKNTSCLIINKQNKEVSNLSAVLYGKNDLRLEERPVPVPTANQVLLKIDVVGICGSDIHFLTNGRHGPFVLNKPLVLGHEGAGTVVEVGKKVKHLKNGDRVAIEPGLCCRKCVYCKTGRYNLCPHIKFCATPSKDGSLTRYYAHEADFCFKLPNHVSVEEGALLEPLACAVHACRRGKITIGSTVLILGTGPIGLICLMAARAFGASKIVMTDINEDRLEVAQELGANCTIQLCPNYSDSSVIESVYKAFDQEQPSVSIDCSGAEQSIRVAVQVTKAGGKAILIGIGANEMRLPLTNTIFRELDILGVLRFPYDYPKTLDMVATGKVDLLSLVTHRFPLLDTVQAFETARTGEGNAIKVLIYPNSNPC